MSEMFLTKKERAKIAIESVIFVALILLFSYYTMFGNLFVRMLPLLYILGVISECVFKKAAMTSVLGFITMVIIGFVVKNTLDMYIILLAIYSALMILCGSLAGFAINELFLNYKLKKFIKYYTKIKLIAIVCIFTILPIAANAFINTNIISYNKAITCVKEYANERYDSPSISVIKSEYIPNVKGGKYIFTTVIDDVKLQLCYYDGKVQDSTINERLEQANKELDSRLKTIISDIEVSDDIVIAANCEYTKVSIWPDVVNIDITGNEKRLVEIVKLANYLLNENSIGNIGRINITIDEKSMSIDMSKMKERITLEYVQNGINQELLDSQEDN